MSVILFKLVMILEKTIELILQIYKYHKIMPPKVNNVVIGLGYTGVELYALAYEPFLGLAYTMPSVINNIDCSKNEFAGDLTNRSFTELLTWSLEPPSLKKIIGIATLNAVSQHILAIKNPYNELKEDLINYLKINDKTRVTFIGFIKSLVEKVHSITEFTTIVDDNPYSKKFSSKYNIKRNLDELKEAEFQIDILFCTGSTLINNTLEDILSLYNKNVKYIALIGPTVSFIPDILFDQGVDIVGGMKILDSKSVLQIIQEGGGTKLFKRYGEKYNFIKEGL